MKKKIAIVTRKLVSGGIEKALINMINEIDADITLYLMGRGGEFEKFLPNNIKINNIYGYEKSFKEKVINKVKEFKLYEAIKTGFYLTKAINALKKDKYFEYEYFLSKTIQRYNEEYDLVISYHAPATFPIRYSVDFINANKRIAWIHGDVSKCRSKLKNYIKYYEKCDKIFCISKTVKDIFDSEYPTLKSKTDVFYNLVNTKEILQMSNQFDVFTKKENETVILTVGRIEDEKGQLIIPDVIKQLLQDNLEFKWYCIGDGTLKKQLQDKIDKYKIGENLILLGEKENPYPYFKNCDIYVQTSKHEGYGLTLHEAKVFNKPIITTRNLGASEQIKNNYNGIIVDYSVDELYSSIKNLINDVGMRNRLSETLFNESSWYDYKSEIEKIYKII